MTRDSEFYEVAAKINQRVIDRLYADPPNGQPVVVILAGGAGSGKTTSSNLGNVSKDFVIDTVLGYPGGIEWHTERAKKHGRNVSFVYVYTPFEKAFPRVIERFLDSEDSRLVPLSVVVDGHIGAQQNILNAPTDTEIVIVDNSYGFGEHKRIDRKQLEDYNYLHERNIGVETSLPEGAYRHDSSSGTGQAQQPATGRREALAQARARGIRGGRKILEAYREQGRLTQEQVDAFLEEGKFSPPSYSMAPGNYVERMRAMVDSTPKRPVERLEVYNRARQKLAQLKERFPEHGQPKQTFKEIDERRKVREEEIYDAKIQANAGTFEALENAEVLSNLKEQPVVAELLNNVGKLRSKTEERKQNGNRNIGLYDDAPYLPSYFWGGVSLGTEPKQNPESVPLGTEP